MKKNLFSKLFILLAVTLFTVGCSKETVDLPVVEFSSEISDLTVTFTTTAIGATSYSWDFGDGETSTEKDPVHVYAANGTYTVVLTATNESGSTTSTESVVIAKSLIKIDGSFTDWTEVSSDILSTATLPDGASLTALKTLKVCADDNFIYVYMKIDTTDVNPVDLFFDTDNTATTGANSWLFADAGADILMEGMLHSNLDVDVFKHDDTAGADAWTWNTAIAAGSGIINMSECKTVSGKIVEFEASIVREMIPTTLADNIKMGVFISYNSWAEAGALPIQVSGEDVLPMLTVKLKH
ncbi:MAG: PKD domain-containing protein [Bacteroidales bacterium]|nr:PKD domain-containing protein [Bacteroidales bacterium]